MKNNVLLVVYVFVSILGFSQQAATNCSNATPACTLPAFDVSPPGGTATEIIGNNISNPSTNPNPVPGNSGCSFSNGVNPNWVSITVVSNGILEFTLGQSGGSGFFDWVLWENTNGNACTDISNNTLPPVACNWNASSAGFTGMAAPGNLPAGANQGNFEYGLNVNAGDQFVLLFSNYSGIFPLSVALDFNIGPNSAAVSCTPAIMPEQTICQGDTAYVHVPQINGLGQPLNITNYSWSPATNIDNPSGGPDVALYPTDSTWYYVTLTSIDSTWTDSVKINVVHIPTPYAGLDDSICHSTTAGYQFSPSLSNQGNNVLWEYYLGPSNSPGTPNSIFQPNASNLNATALTNWPGLYQYILHEIDTSGYCPDGTDTISIFFSKETHTSTVTQPTCFDSNDGMIQVTSTGLIGAVLYGFNGVAVNIQSDTSGLAPGIYTVVSQDPVGCTYTQTDTIIAPPPVLITAGPSNPDTTVCENATATVYANASNGNSFEYHWDFTSDLGPVQQISPINDTTVSVFAVNNTGCHSDTLSITVNMYQPISIDYLINDTICPGYDASMFINASGGFQGYNYEWTENGQLMSDNTPIINVNPIIETTYCVTVSDNCQSTPKTACADVIMREVPQPSFSSNVIEACVPAEVTFYDITTYNLAETQTDSVNWYIEGELYHSDSVYHLFEIPGLYDVTYEVYTQYGCHNSTEITDYLTIHSLPQPNFFINPNPTTIFITEVDMVNMTPDDSTNTYQWFFPGGNPSNSNIKEPTVLYPEGIADDYPVQLIVTNQHGCKDSLNDVLHIVSDVLIFAPNAFTPDNDQRNNTWRVYINGIDVEDFHLLIFNRWGEVVWESYDPDAEWKGNYVNGTIQDGTYVWRIITKDFNTDKKYEFRGMVTILK